MTCDVTFDTEVDPEQHEEHETHPVHGSTYFALGWGHLEARLQTCLIQVSSNKVQS